MNSMGEVRVVLGIGEHNSLLLSWGLKNHVTSLLPYPQEFNEMK